MLREYVFLNINNMKKILLFGAALCLFAACSKDGGSERQVSVVVGFENVPVAYLAGPTSAGDNLYDTTRDGKTYSIEQYVSYMDETTGLVLSVNDYTNYYTSEVYPSLYGGGSFLSQWNDMTGKDYNNQCSVYYKDAVTGNGGNNGSKTFAVCNGYLGVYGDTCATFIFAGETTQKKIFSLYVALPTYTYFSLKDGDAYARKMDYEHNDYFKVIFKGLDANDNEVGQVEYFLADFRTASAPGIVLGWNKVNLESLGQIHKLVVDFDGTDKAYGDIVTPAYCAIDDIEVEK